MRGRWLVCKRALFSPYTRYFAKLLRPAKQKGAKIYTLPDAAALATTCPIDLSDEGAPGFTCVSFYKIFGFPNVGALVRKEAGHMLQQRKYFGGGTVDMITAPDDTWHATMYSHFMMS